jgi:PAS domain S-box-containing protein
MHTTKLASVLEVLEALEGTDTAAWAWDLGTDAIRWSANTGPLFGYERGYQPASYATVLESLHPDDRNAVREAIDAAVANNRDFETEFRVPWSDGSVHWISSRGHVVVDDEGAARRIVGVMSDVTSRKRRHEQDRFLVVAGEILAQALTVDETVERIARLLVADLSDWCVVEIFDVERPPSVAHHDPAKEELARRLQRDYPPPTEPTGLGAEAVARRCPVLVEHVTDEMVRAAAVDDHHYEVMRSLGLRSAIVAPLLGRARVVGLMTLICAETPYRFGPDDVGFAEDLGRRAGMAIESARLWEEAESARRRAEHTSSQLVNLQDVIAGLSKASTIREVTQTAIERAIAATTADRGAVVLGTEDGPRIVASTGYDPSRLEAMAPSLRQPGPLNDAILGGGPVYCQSVGELVDRYPNLAEVMAPVPSGSFAAIPLYGARGLLGAIGFVGAADDAFPIEERRLLASIAQHVGVAVERSSLFDRINTVAETLQAALAPPVEVGCDQVEAAAFYRPAGEGSVGGDWYDVIATPRGTSMYVIGDVVGRGLEAVAAMAQLRQSARLLISEGRSPSQVLAALSVFASNDRNALASTMQCAEVDPQTRTVTLASAGHLPPVMVGHGVTTMIDVPLATPLGVSDLGGGDHVIGLEPGHCLVMYTDGVVERRDRDIDTSLRALRSRLETLPAEVDVIAADLLKLADEADDDATILVISFGEGAAG